MPLRGSRSAGPLIVRGGCAGLAKSLQGLDHQCLLLQAVIHFLQQVRMGVLELVFDEVWNPELL